jgi:hypothetical protein
MQQLPGAAQYLLTLRTAELLWRHGADKAVAGGTWVMLLDLLTAQFQCDGLRSQPRQKGSNGVVVQAPFLVGERSRRLLIANGSSSGTGCLAIRLTVILDVAGGKVQESRASVTLIGKYESRDSR